MEAVIASRRTCPTSQRRLSAADVGGWLCAAFFILGLAARFRQYLGNPSYWYDEAFLTLEVFRHSCRDLLGPLAGRTIIPPFFLWLLRGCYRALGPGEWALRLPAFVAGLAAMLLLIPLARRWLGKTAWPWAVAFCAISTHAIHHAVEVRAYSSDLMATVLVLLAGLAVLRGGQARVARGRPAALLAAAILCPWLSFTSVFVLGAVSAAILAQSLDPAARRTRLILWAGFTAVLGLSAALVWLVQARHLYYPGLKAEWVEWGGFPRDYSFATLFTWGPGAMVQAAHYATTGLGVPLLALGAAGVVRHWRRSKPETLLLVGPISIAFLAALLGKYPFADRPVFFLAPCIWLTAVDGIIGLLERLPHRRLATLAILAGLLGPGVVSTAKLAWTVQPKMEYREALEYVEQHRSTQDVVWGWCGELSSVYYDYLLSVPEKPTIKAGLPDATTDLVDLSRPFWIVAPDGPAQKTVDALRSRPVVESLRRQFLNMEVIRYAPAEAPAAAQMSKYRANS